MNKKLIYNLEDIIIYMLNTNSSIRTASAMYGIDKSKLAREIKQYNGVYKKPIEDLLKENKIKSQKNCGNNRWHKNI